MIINIAAEKNTTGITTIVAARGNVGIKAISIHSHSPVYIRSGKINFRASANFGGGETIVENAIAYFHFVYFNVEILKAYLSYGLHGVKIGKGKVSYGLHGVKIDKGKVSIGLHGVKILKVKVRYGITNIVEVVGNLCIYANDIFSNLINKNIITR